jgi:hypothetical protein
MPSGRRLKRKKRDQREKEAPSQPLAPENLDDRLNPFKRLFPFDFPGQVGDWPKKRAK